MSASYVWGQPATSSAASIVAAAEEMAGIHPGETTADGTLSLLIARCLGACGLAPAGVFDGEVAGRLTAAQVQARLEGWMHHDK